MTARVVARRSKPFGDIEEMTHYEVTARGAGDLEEAGPSK
jgi:hypothetical protein